MKIKSNIALSSLLISTSTTTLFQVVPVVSSKESPSIAVIGGGIGGTFVTKYLTDYDVECKLDSITIYEPYSILSDYPTNDSSSQDNVIPSYEGNNTSSNNNDSNLQQQQQQGPRVSSIQLSDGTIVELGASIIFNGNQYAVEMLQNDPDNLMKVEPLSSSITQDEEPIDGLGIYNGILHDESSSSSSSSSSSNETIWPLYTTNMTNEQTTSTLLWRYNLDLYKITKSTKQALQSFQTLYQILNSNDISSFDYTSPNDLWKYSGLDYAAKVSFDELLDYIGVDKTLSWWRKWVLGKYHKQGLVREELLTAMNICNNNKNNGQMTGLAGLVNFVASQGDLFAVQGGNHNLITSAYRQSKANYVKQCTNNPSTQNDIENKIKHIPKRIKTVVSDFESNGMQLFDENGKLQGTYDIVILAAPIQFSDISFLTKGSLFDNQVLQPMTLNNGMIDGEKSNANDHGHKPALVGGGVGWNLPDSCDRQYTQVVTTVVSNGVLNKAYFHIDEGRIIPKSILFTEQGREEMNISSIGRITKDIFKVFSSNELSTDTIKEIFGENVKVEHVKVWGGKNGGATPDFNGGGDSSYASDFLLYDGGHGENSFDHEGSALYYVNSMESAVSAIEISAIGAKAVAKLVARRLKLLQPFYDVKGEEL